MLDMQTQDIHGTDLSKRYRRSSREQIVAAACGIPEYNLEKNTNKE